jgi:hypothetical protein
VIHPDLSFQDTPPLYVVFIALQNVTEDMYPTLYLMGTHQTMETATGSMRPQKQSGLVVSFHVHHISPNKLDYGKNDADDANNSKTADSLHSSMSSLWCVSFASMATEIITANDVANIVVQSKTQDDMLKVFCHHILTTLKPANGATSINKGGIPETTCTEQSDQEEMVYYLHRILTSAYSSQLTDLGCRHGVFQA